MGGLGSSTAGLGSFNDTLRVERVEVARFGRSLANPGVPVPRRWQAVRPEISAANGAVLYEVRRGGWILIRVAVGTFERWHPAQYRPSSRQQSVATREVSGKHATMLLCLGCAADIACGRSDSADSLEEA